jgi:two-component system copper resistance phosphate regulon response regulator CusR
MTKLSKILIIEDEPKVAAFIKKGLEENLYDAEIAIDGLLGKEMALSNKYEAVILDINLPKVNGFDVCKEIRNQNQKVPVLMLTALSTTEDKLKGFDLGADDYLVKPFEFKELLARIKVLIKRSQTTVSVSNILKVADLELNSESKSVYRNKKKIELTAKEFNLLEYLMVNKGKVLSKAQIAEKVWEISFDSGTNVIEVYINFLRKKIDKDSSLKLIHTQIGMGYVLKEDNQ